MLRAPAKLEYFKTKCFWNNIFQQKQWSSHNGINNLKTLVLKFSILFFTLYIWVERAQQSFQCLKLLKVLIGNGRRVPYILPRSHPWPFYLKLQHFTPWILTSPSSALLSHSMCPIFCPSSPTRISAPWGQGMLSMLSLPGA